MGDWWSDFNHLTSDLIHLFDECVWPALSSTSNTEYFYMLFQTDTEPGLAERFSQHGHLENLIRFMEADKYLVNREEQAESFTVDNVSQNVPNPCRESTSILIDLKSKVRVELNVVNMMGQSVIDYEAVTLEAGQHSLRIDVSSLTSGIYFYRARIGETIKTGKITILQ